MMASAGRSLDVPCTAREPYAEYTLPSHLDARQVKALVDIRELKQEQAERERQQTEKAASEGAAFSGSRQIERDADMVGPGEKCNDPVKSPLR